jgi:hypothetical protein
MASPAKVQYPAYKLIYTTVPPSPVGYTSLKTLNDFLVIITGPQKLASNSTRLGICIGFKISDESISGIISHNVKAAEFLDRGDDCGGHIDGRRDI